MLLLIFLFILLPLSGPGAQESGAAGVRDLIRLPDVTLRGEDSAVLSPPPPLRPPPLSLRDMAASWPAGTRSESAMLGLRKLPDLPPPLPPLLIFIAPELQIGDYASVKARAPGSVSLIYVPGFLLSLEVREQAAAGNWTMLPALSLSGSDIWLYRDRDREIRSRLYGSLRARRGFSKPLALGLHAELGYIGSDEKETAVFPYSLSKELSWRGQTYTCREETRVLGSGATGPGAPGFAGLLEENLAAEASGRVLGGRASLQAFTDLDERALSLQTRIEALASLAAAGLTLEAGGAVRYDRGTWKIFPSGRVLVTPRPGFAFRLSAEPLLSLPDIPDLLIRNSYSSDPDWRPEAVYRIASGALLSILPGLEADLQAEYRWGGFYRSSAPGWLFFPDDDDGTLSGRLLYRAESRLRFSLLARAGLSLAEKRFSLSPQTLKGGIEIDFNKPLLTFILELLWGRDPYTEPNPVLSAWGEYFSGTAVTLRSDWYLGARHILRQGLCYTMKTAETGGEIRFLLGYGIRTTEE
jgi:hypothetical protein